MTKKALEAMNDLQSFPLEGDLKTDDYLFDSISIFSLE